MHQTFEEFVFAVRSAGIRVSVDEVLTAYRTVSLVGYQDRDVLRDALAAVMAKTLDDRREFEQVFDRFFSTSDYQPALEKLVEPNDADSGYQRQIAQTSSPDFGSTRLLAAMQEAARHVRLDDIEHLGQRNVFMYRLLRELGLEALDEELAGLESSENPDHEQLARLQQRREALIEQAKRYTERHLALYGKGKRERFHQTSLREKSLASQDYRDQAEMQQLVRHIARRLAAVHARRSKRAQRGLLDVRQTLRRNTGYDGALWDIQWKRKKVDRPRIVAICDVSRSVSPYSRFLLLFLYSLADAIHRSRTFVFCSDVAEVTSAFQASEPTEVIDTALTAAPKGYTDYGQSFQSMLDRFADALTPKTTVLILGDARNNQLPAGASALRQIQQRSRGIIWLNPEPENRWGQGDSEMGNYRPFCRMVRRCGNINDLERAINDMLNALTRQA
ncbi:MAG: VWA domain-containing protein [Pseudomonadota bacterium]|nr:VWA domain-containing protein [Pseudomonadota bacterium]